MFCLFFCFISSKTLFLKANATNEESCDIGCNSNTLKKNLQDQDKVFLIDKILSKTLAIDFLKAINETTAKEFEIYGNNSIIPVEKTNFTRYPSILFNEKTVKLYNLTFAGFRRPIIQSLRSTIFFKNISFVNSSTKHCSLIALIGGELSGTKIKIQHCSTKNQSLFVCSGTTVDFDSFDFIQNKGTKDPLLYFNQGQISFNSSQFYSNTADVMMTASTATSLIMRDPLFDDNTALTMINSETECEVRLIDSWFGNNTGTIIKATTSVIELKFIGIISHESDYTLFNLTESVITVEECNITKSSIKSFMEARGKGSSTNAMQIRARSLYLNDTMFKCTGGRVEVEMFRADRIESGSDVVFMDHRKGIKNKISDARFSKINSTKQIACFGNISNVRSAEVTKLKFHKNKICGFVMENTKSVFKGNNFTKNTCNPKESSQIYSMISYINSNVNVTNSYFNNNKVLDGNILAINSSSNIKECIFYNNTASFGAGIHSINTTMDISDSLFLKNTALVSGASIQSQGKLITIQSSNFSQNTAPHGPTLALSKGNANFINVWCGKNNGNGTLVNALGNCTIHFENSIVYDKKDIAISAKDSSLVFIETFFNSKSSSSIDGESYLTYYFIIGFTITFIAIFTYLKVFNKSSSKLPGALR